VYLLMKSVFSI